MLHTIYLGLLKHLMEWITGFMKKYDHQTPFDTIRKQLSPYPKISIPNKPYRQVSQWQGKEMRNLGKFLLRALTAAMKNPAPSERLPFKKALHCTQALVDFQLAAQYLSHTETMFGYMASYLAKFENYRDLFLEKEKLKRKRESDDKREQDEQVQDALRNHGHFNFIKMHLLTYFTWNIRKFGNIPMWSTEIGEASHKDMFKTGYRTFNHIDTNKQIFNHYGRRFVIAMHIAEIRQAGSTRSRENWAVDTIELWKRLPSPKEDPGLFSDSIPSRMLKGPVNRKKTIHFGDIIHELGDTNDNLLIKLLLYSKRYLPTAEELCTDFEKLPRFPAERFMRLEVPVLKFQQTKAYNPISYNEQRINTALSVVVSN
ncbi:hypothetical protein Q9L58_010001, partial [Maublancomyces gigas]